MFTTFAGYATINLHYYRYRRMFHFLSKEDKEREMLEVDRFCLELLDRDFG